MTTPRRRLARGMELDPNKVADALEARGMVRRRPHVPTIEPLGPLEDFPDDPAADPAKARSVIAAAGITPSPKP